MLPTYLGSISLSAGSCFRNRALQPDWRHHSDQQEASSEQRAVMLHILIGGQRWERLGGCLSFLQIGVVSFHCLERRVQKFIDSFQINKIGTFESLQTFIRSQTTLLLPRCSIESYWPCCRQFQFILFLLFSFWFVSFLFISSGWRRDAIKRRTWSSQRKRDSRRR